MQDVLAAIQFVRGNAKEFNIAPDRIGVFGHSAGGNLGALAALGGRSPLFANGYPQDAHAKESTEVKVFAGVYGVYDVAEMWQQVQHPEPEAEQHRDVHRRVAAGQPPALFRRLADQLRLTANNKIAVHLSVGTEDDLVDRRAHTDAFVLALKQAGFFVRTTHPARRAALLGQRSDRRAGQLLGLPGAAADAVPGGEALTRPLRPRRSVISASGDHL